MNDPLVVHPAQDAEPSTRASAPVLLHPDDVLDHPELSDAEKRALLASWLSDANAVEEAPSWRRLDSGAVVHVDQLLAALKRLDGVGAHTDHPARAPLPRFSRRRERLLSRLRWRVASRRSRDDDDDPPPTPASAALPFVPAPAEPAREQLEWAA